MKIVYYTYPSFLDPALHFIKELSKYCELYCILELSPETFHSGFFDIEPRNFNSRLENGVSFFTNNFPPFIKEYLENVIDFKITIFKNKHACNPINIFTIYPVIKYLQKVKPDFIHFDQITIRSFPILYYFKNIYIVVNIHDPLPHSGEDNWKGKLIFKISKKHINRYILFNSFLIKDFSFKYKIDQTLIYSSKLGIYHIYKNYLLDLKYNGNKQTILLIGRLSHYKGIEEFIEAAKILSFKVKNVDFIIAGKSIKNYKLPPIPELNNNNRIIVTDRYLNNSELANLISQSLMIICPYRDATQSGVVLTAYAFEKPIVATNVGALSEYIIDNITGILVQQGNISALADAIFRIYSDVTYMNMLSNNIKSLKNLNWTNIVQNTIKQIYNSID